MLWPSPKGIAPARADRLVRTADDGDGSLVPDADNWVAAVFNQLDPDGRHQCEMARLHHARPA
jgi:hypothetical protein